MDVHNRQMEALGLCKKGCEHICVSIQKALSFARTLVDVYVKPLNMCVGGFHRPGLHRFEGSAQESLIERDLRDMAEVNVLRHAGTGRWWAIKTSRKLRTTDVCLCACMFLFVPLQ